MAQPPTSIVLFKRGMIQKSASGTSLDATTPTLRVGHHCDSKRRLAENIFWDDELIYFHVFSHHFSIAYCIFPWFFTLFPHYFSLILSYIITIHFRSAYFWNILSYSQNNYHISLFFHIPKIITIHFPIWPSKQRWESSPGTPNNAWGLTVGRAHQRELHEKASGDPGISPQEAPKISKLI